MSALAAPESADIAALVETLSDSLAQVEEISERPRVSPHVKLLIQSANTASMTAKRLVAPLKNRPVAKTSPDDQSDGPSTDEMATISALLTGAMCPVCGGKKSDDLEGQISVFLQS